MSKPRHPASIRANNHAKRRAVVKKHIQTQCKDCKRSEDLSIYADVWIEYLSNAYPFLLISNIIPEHLKDTVVISLPADLEDFEDENGYAIATGSNTVLRDLAAFRKSCRDLGIEEQNSCSHQYLDCTFLALKLNDWNLLQLTSPIKPQDGYFVSLPINQIYQTFLDKNLIS